MSRVSTLVKTKSNERKLFQSFVLILVVVASSRAGVEGRNTPGEDERLIGWRGEVPRSEARVGANGTNRANANATRRIDVEPLSWTPRAFRLRRVLSHEECDDVVARARGGVRRSTVIDSQTGVAKVDSIRTSKHTFLMREDDVVRKVYERLSEVTLLPWTHNEDMQVLSYAETETYKPHEDVGEDGSVSGEQLSRDGGLRVATALLYLNDPEEGGETAFPDAEWIDPSEAEGVEWSACAKNRVAMKPKKGDGLLFWSVHPDGKIDHRAMHTGCPVVRGEKWTATVWVHARPYKWSAPPAPLAPVGCEDKEPRCRTWANIGECDANPGFMRLSCKWSCKVPGCEHPRQDTEDGAHDL